MFIRVLTVYLFRYGIVRYVLLYYTTSNVITVQYFKYVIERTIPRCGVYRVSVSCPTCAKVLRFLVCHRFPRTYQYCSPFPVLYWYWQSRVSWIFTPYIIVLHESLRCSLVQSSAVQSVHYEVALYFFRSAQHSAIWSSYIITI